jgi:hypothetical protein
MKRVLFALVCLGSTASADVTIVDNDAKLDIDCAKDKSVTVAGNNATLTLNGVCEVVTLSGNEAKVSGSVKAIGVTGNKNTVTLDAVDSIVVSGNENVVTYKKPIAKKKTGVANSGNKNKVGKAKS